MVYKPRKMIIDILVGMEVDNNFIIDAIKDYSGEWDGVSNDEGQDINEAIFQLVDARKKYSEVIKKMKAHRCYLIKTKQI